MKARALLLTALFSSALWLFFSEDGRRRRDQVMRMVGRGTAAETDGGSRSAPTTPLPFPPIARHPAADPAPADAPATATAPTAEASAPVAPAPAVAPPASDGPTPEEAQAQPASPAEDAAASAEPAPAVQDDTAQVRVEEVTDEGAPEPNPRLEEVLQELVEEIETHAIGQEPDVKVEEELDQATLEQIGVPSEAPVTVQPPQDEQASAAPSASGDTRWVGNRRKMIAHPPRGGRLPAEENRVYFASREEAIAAGYSVIEQGEH